MMKKVFLIGLAATAMITSCSNDETVEVASQKAIGFESFVDKATKVDKDLTNTTLTEFAVYGIAYNNTSTIKVLGNEKVSRPTTVTDISTDAGNTTWTYTSKQYWNKGYTYWFSAIAPYGGNWTFGEATDSYYGFATPSATSGHIGRTLKFDNSSATGAKGLQDLIYSEVDAEAASSHPSTSSNENVKFTFKHLLSRLKFTFNNNVGDQYILKVTDIKIAAKDKDNTVAIYTGGTYKTKTDAVTAVNGTWTTIDSDEGFDLAFNNQDVYQKEVAGTKYYNLDASDAQIVDHRYVIPQDNNTDITLVCSFKLYARSTQTGDADYSLDYPRPTSGAQAAAKECTNVELKIPGGLKQGYSYNFVANITAENIESDLVPINFSVEKVGEYTSASDVDITVPTL